MPANAAPIESEASLKKRPRRYLKVHHNNIVNIHGRHHTDAAGNADQVATEPGLQTNVHPLYDAMVTALGLVAATQLSVIFVRVLTL